MLNIQQEKIIPGLASLRVYGSADSEFEYYYVSTLPKVARDNEAYQFSFLQFSQPVDNIAGALSFVVDLSVSENELEKAKTYLSQQAGGDVSLASMPWLSATAACSFPGGEAIVAKPSAFSDNAATLHFDLTVEQLLLLKQALQHHQADELFSIVYRLTVDSLQPALNCKMHVDFKKYREFIKKQLQIGIPFLKFTKTDIYETLEKNRVISVSCVNKQTESTEGLKRAVLSFFQSFLTPLPQVQKPENSSSSDSSILGYQYTEEKDEQTFQKEVDVDLNTQSGIRQSVHIQGLIQGIQAAYAHNASSTIAVGASAPFHQMLNVTNYADFNRDRINIVIVCFYDENKNVIETLTYRQGSKQSQTVGLSYLSSDRYHYDVELYLRDANGTHPPKSPKRALSYSDSLIAIIPRELYSILDIDVQTTADFPWELMTSVTVQLRYPTDKTYRLNPQQPQQLDRIVLNDSRPSLCTFDLIFLPLNSSIGSRFEITQTSVNSSLAINPFKSRTVTINASTIDWTRYESIKVVIKCEQNNKALNGIKTLILTIDQPQADFEYYVTQAEQRTVSGMAYFKTQGETIPLSIPIPKTMNLLISIDQPS